MTSPGSLPEDVGEQIGESLSTIARASDGVDLMPGARREGGGEPERQRNSLKGLGATPEDEIPTTVRILAAPAAIGWTDPVRGHVIAKETGNEFPAPYLSATRQMGTDPLLRDSSFSLLPSKVARLCQINEEKNAEQRASYTPSKDLQMSLHDLRGVLADQYKSQLFDQFSRRVENLRRHKCNSALKLTTYFDLASFDFKHIRGKVRTSSGAGSVLLVWLFYSRLYEKMLAQMSEKPLDPFFAPLSLDPTERRWGFREVLDFAADFNLKRPSLLLTRHTLERVWETLLPAIIPKEEQEALSSLDGTPGTFNPFHFKINFDEFIDFLIVCAESNWTRGALLDAWRDRHFWRASQHTDNPQELPRRAFALAQPRKKVAKLSPTVLPQKLKEVKLREQIHGKFVWMERRELWESYEGPWVDMGIQELGTMRQFRLDITNARLHRLWLQTSVEDCEAVRVASRTEPLAPGTRATVAIFAEPRQCGEWSGSIALDVITAKGEAERVRVPLYLRVVPKNAAHPRAEQLPHHAPHPFQKRNLTDSGLQKMAFRCITSNLNMMPLRPGSALTEDGRRSQDARKQTPRSSHTPARSKSEAPLKRTHLWGPDPDTTLGILPEGVPRSLPFGRHPPDWSPHPRPFLPPSGYRPVDSEASARSAASSLEEKHQQHTHQMLSEAPPRGSLVKKKTVEDLNVDLSKVASEASLTRLARSLSNKALTRGMSKTDNQDPEEEEIDDTPLSVKSPGASPPPRTPGSVQLKSPGKKSVTGFSRTGSRIDMASILTPSGGGAGSSPAGGSATRGLYGYANAAKRRASAASIAASVLIAGSPGTDSGPMTGGGRRTSVAPGPVGTPSLISAEHDLQTRRSSLLAGNARDPQYRRGSLASIQSVVVMKDKYKRPEAYKKNAGMPDVQRVQKAVERRMSQLVGMSDSVKMRNSSAGGIAEKAEDRLGIRVN
uniref:Uncharacterized protein n=1 Tax=Chromera velia CCMP2878 TaxID=1169474 RepID=A0A0G4GK01_9ALVE|eukprot:Cvel_22256.t1-p1 / transcript=Cvel_22256.t1 / gene=Cvel_22256 / organism=Chromera_velia_CCMP2878 / gene_product=hypothetical protein / transcript_product=hypothetical protein / location=Cvel_scaffold2169:6140-10211(-) / protein_length=948 / sequence_SO=supercontig / SO=protein_coding / is_pseudo=false